MGLGPNGTSLLDRCGHPALVWRDPFAMQLEQQDRGEARRLKAIWHAQRHRTPAKPLAPVTPCKKEKGLERRWIWNGQLIESKKLYPDGDYTGAEIRKAGFKLPKLVKEAKSGRSKHSHD